ncbi:hypothetical protein BD414DRAFT_44416 [Trametes punicea]|nr:hypothetical protein BD414DRAFT_44416 [Trametes punicea]
MGRGTPTGGARKCRNDCLRGVRARRRSASACSGGARARWRAARRRPSLHTVIRSRRACRPPSRPPASSPLLLFLSTVLVLNSQLSSPTTLVLSLMSTAMSRLTVTTRTTPRAPSASPPQPRPRFSSSRTLRAQAPPPRTRPSLRSRSCLRPAPRSQALPRTPSRSSRPWAGARVRSARRPCTPCLPIRHRAPRQRDPSGCSIATPPPTEEGTRGRTRPRRLARNAPRSRSRRWTRIPSALDTSVDVSVFSWGVERVRVKLKLKLELMSDGRASDLKAAIDGHVGGGRGWCLRTRT